MQSSREKSLLSHPSRDDFGSCNCRDSKHAKACVIRVSHSTRRRHVQELPGEILAFSIAETARRTSLSKATVWRRVRDGTIPTVMVGKRRLIPAASLRKLVGAA
ncbi:helix-turn-helix domain-containing protein [Novosphingobium sp. 9U]|uniref:helix-turn-helix domain-containing protein n=1 Tax=Novosphingobium sp. 9U TaxID=2653158 RepID=UPI00352E7602